MLSLILFSKLLHCYRKLNSESFEFKIAIYALNVLKIANIDCKRKNIFIFFLIFYQLILSLPRVSLVHLIIMCDFEYNILIITIYNTSAKSFLCKVQRAKFVFVLVKACSCIVQLFSGV